MTTAVSMVDLASIDLSVYADSEDKAPHILNNNALIKTSLHSVLLFIYHGAYFST